MKEEIFSKFNIKNYNNELEKILEAKDFSKDTKNLLLSMLYKVETSYNDYAKVKRNVENKNEFIELILNNIKLCEDIRIVKPTTNREEELEKQKKTFCINKEQKSIETFPNEKSILYGIYYLGNEKMYLNEKYDYIRIAFPAMLNEGKDNNKVEIIRDFNAWSWNTSIDEITDLKCNLIYQNLLILLGYYELDNWMKSQNYEEKIEILEDKLNSLYGEENSKDLLNLIYKISISLCANKNSKEKQRLEEEFKYVKIDYNKIQNKRAYLMELSGKKKEALEKIGKVDMILKDNDTLLEEFLERNEKLPKYNKIMNVNHLVQILQKERKKALKDIEECNSMMEPANFIKKQDKIKKEYELLEYLEKDASSELEELQKVFINAFSIKIEKASNRKELIDLMYILRYYFFIPYTKDLYVKDNKNLKENLSNISSKLVNKMFEFKIINKQIDNNKLSVEIISKIFETRIIDLEDAEIELIQNDNNSITINLFDKEEFEKSFVIVYDEGSKIKAAKRIKLFN